MTTDTNPDSGRIITSGDVINDLHDTIDQREAVIKLLEQDSADAHARITELEAQLEAVGAGGVSLYGGDSYGDGNVYRGARSADSKTCTFYAIALAQRGREIDEYYAQHLALELECMLIDPHEWWDSAAKVLDAYKAAWSEINPGPPTFMGEPVPPERKAIYAAIRAQRAAAQGEKP
jgi:hypothetical protein